MSYTAPAFTPLPDAPRSEEAVQDFIFTSMLAVEQMMKDQRSEDEIQEWVNADMARLEEAYVSAAEALGVKPWVARREYTALGYILTQFRPVPVPFAGKPYESLVTERGHVHDPEAFAMLTESMYAAISTVEWGMGGYDA